MACCCADFDPCCPSALSVSISGLTGAFRSFDPFWYPDGWLEPGLPSDLAHPVEPSIRYVSGLFELHWFNVECLNGSYTLLPSRFVPCRLWEGSKQVENAGITITGNPGTYNLIPSVALVSISIAPSSGSSQFAIVGEVLLPLAGGAILRWTPRLSFSKVVDCSAVSNHPTYGKLCCDSVLAGTYTGSYVTNICACPSPGPECFGRCTWPEGFGGLADITVTVS
jgi:hypothetical protein